MTCGLVYKAMAFPTVSLAIGTTENLATAEQKLGELRALLERKGIPITDGATFVQIVNAAIDLIEGRPPEDRYKPMSRTANQADLLELTDAERPLMEKALAQSGGDFAAAIVSVQRDLMDRQRELGFTNVAARGRLATTYPNLFA